ncbi:MAG TPA: glycosyltransferase family 39 protein [Vicinamibacteria bacterium]|nr:glycosyltransferase family 39 protein [Vicinamibacteria bacterium]
MRRSPDRAAGAGAVAALLWVAFCVRWFDVAIQWRPAFLAAVPPLALLGAGGLAAALWLRGRWRTLCGPAVGPAAPALLLVLLLAFFFRLPVVVAGAGATVTPDGALSGIVALHVADGSARDVFVPRVPYSGSLKSHLTAPLTLAMDPARAFALVSVLFYLAYVAGLFRLALLVAGPRAALLAGLYAAFSPPFLTRYSLSNDGNYVEVLALGTWALWLALRGTQEEEARPRLAFAAGLLLGLAFWCHILAVIHAAALAALLAAVAVVPRTSSPDGRRGIRLRRGLATAARSLVALGMGGAVGYVPGWLWNAANEWASFQYLLPGEARPGEGGDAAVAASGLADKLRLMVTDHWPVLMGYDSGYGPLVSGALLSLAWLGVAVALVAAARTGRRAWRERSWPLAGLLLFAATNVALALLALPHLPGNPRYLLFLMSVVPVFLADAFGEGPSWRRAVLGVLIATGAAASFAQVPPTLRQDARWRRFVADMEHEGVRFCYTDFFMATRVNFLSRERIVCSAKLGPITTEYFFEYRERVEAAPEAAFIAVNRTSAGRLEGRLRALGVGYERKDWMKPVLLRLSRKVDPQELFPGREFPLR